MQIVENVRQPNRERRLQMLREIAHSYRRAFKKASSIEPITGAKAVPGW
jgi:hypothetical protein